MNKTQKSTIKALFQRDNGEVLIAKSARDEFWELPGGSVEWGEQPEQTLAREVDEEFGVKKFEIVKLLGMFSFLATDDDTEWNFIVSVFLCKLETEKFTISDEHETVAWVKPENIRTYSMRKGYYNFFEYIL